MPDSEKTAMLLGEMAALDPAQRHEVAEELRQVSETFAEMPDGRHTAHALEVAGSLPRSELAGADPPSARIC
jgi:hypothetical protein